MTLAENVSFMGAMAHRHKVLLPVLQEHLEDQEGEIIPYVLMAEIARFLVSPLMIDTDNTTIIVEWLEVEFMSGSREVKDLIGAGFVEIIPNPGEPGSTIRAHFGPLLRSVDPWIL